MLKKNPHRKKTTEKKKPREAMVLFSPLSLTKLVYTHR